MGNLKIQKEAITVITTPKIPQIQKAVIMITSPNRLLIK